MAQAPERPRSPLQGMLLRNLRGFRDTGFIEFAPVTFLFGKNSSGKTTLLRAPLLLRQLLLAQSITGEVPLSGPDADFGSYGEAVFSGDRSKDIELQFDIELGERFRNVAARQRGRANLLRQLSSVRVKIQLHWNATRGHSQFSNIRFLGINEEPILSLTRMGPDRIKAEMPGYMQMLNGVSELSFNSLQFLPFQRQQAVDEVQELDYISFILSDALRDAVNRVQHIGPLRDMPERAYRAEKLAVSGGATQSTLGLMSAQSSSIRAASAALKRLGIAERVEITHPAPGYAPRDPRRPH